MLDLVFRAHRVITPEREEARCVGVRDGRIVAVEPFNATLEAETMIEVPRERVLLPGLVDTHVHVNEPGRTEWEGFETATRAAASGGITTILDMPLNSLPPTVDVAALEVKRTAALGRSHVDVGFWGGAVPDNLGELRGLHEAGVFGFKCFLLPSGVEEFAPLSYDELTEVLAELRRLGALLIVHAEDAGVIAAHRARVGPDTVTSSPRGRETRRTWRSTG